MTYTNKENYLTKWNTFVSSLPKNKMGELGRVCHVTLDSSKSYIKRTYTSKMPCVNGKINPYNYTEQEIKNFFLNDVKWTTVLDEHYVLKPIDIDYKEQSITYPYYGLDLYTDEEKFTSIRDFKQQILEMYTYFKEANIFKGNGARCNMVLCEGRIKAFDFKWARLRPENIKLELMSYEIWLKGADQSLEYELKKLSGLQERTHNEFTFDD